MVELVIRRAGLWNAIKARLAIESDWAIPARRRHFDTGSGIGVEARAVVVHVRPIIELLARVGDERKSRVVAGLAKSAGCFRDGLEVASAEDEVEVGSGELGQRGQSSGLDESLEHID